jgi:hypothetical protein
MRSITPVLIDYWHRLPASPVHQRRHHANESCNRVRAGRLPIDALLPFVLGDPDEEVVFSATTAYVGSNRDGSAARPASIDDAIEWVRRGLALNRGAVFAALLARGDPRINARLLPLRLTLGQDEVATVCRRVDQDARRPTRKFLREWAELLGEVDQDAGASSPVASISSVVVGVLAAGGCTVPSHAEKSRRLRSSIQPNTTRCQETRCT